MVMLERYEDILKSVAEEAFIERMNGGSGLYQIGRIPNVEYIDYDTLMHKLKEITYKLEREYFGEIYWDGYDSESFE